LEKSIQLDSSNAQAHYGLGMAYLGSRNMDKAISHWEKVLENQPDFVMALFNLGRAYLERGDKAKALDYLMRLKNEYSHRVPDDMKQRVENLIKRCKE
jgi:tetratricopeptide (TPR) repeat protein